MTQSFTVRGGRNGSRVHICWTDGVLSGDPPTVDLVQVEAELVTVFPEDLRTWGHHVDPDGTMPRAPLADPTAAWRLICSVLDTISEAEGDLPEEARQHLQKGPTS